MTSTDAMRFFPFSGHKTNLLLKWNYREMNDYDGEVCTYSSL